MDDDNSGCLNRSEFFKALKDYRISNDPKEIEAIFKIFDQDNSGSICYNEFIRQIVGKMNVRRESIVTRAFTVMDLNGKVMGTPQGIRYRTNGPRSEWKKEDLRGPRKWKHPHLLVGNG